jgi:pyruvate/2-oxoglutarate dehydrogenase complex dihydrolipoamide dehydrogenase (E3) component
MTSSLSAESGASAGLDDVESTDAGEGVCVRSTRNGSLTAPSRQHDAVGIVSWDEQEDNARRRFEMFDLVVIGGGPAGATAAMRARELGATVALIERGQMGGTCTNDGCVPTRVLAKAARLMRDAEQYAEYGLVGEKPAVDFATLLAQTRHIVHQIHEKKQLQSHLEQAGVTVFANAGEARFVDEHSVALGDGTTLQAEKFILCLGGHARRLPFPGSEYALTHSDIWSLQKLPRHVVVVGGAATGCQLASCFAAFGAHVIVLEVAPRLLTLEDEAVSHGITEAFDRRGIIVITSIGGIQRIEQQDGALHVFYPYDGEVRQLTTEAVVLSVGWQGNTEELNLAAANVQSERGYIVVDDYLQTTAPHIFAAGDITGRMMLVQSAMEEGVLAAGNAVLGSKHTSGHRIVPHGGFTDPEYGSVGLTEEKARAAHDDCVVAVVPYAALDRALIDGHREGFCKLIVSTETHRILGAHIMGEQALEILQLVASSIAAGMQVEQLGEIELAYPTFTAIVGLTARRIIRELGIVPLAPQVRSLGRAYVAEWERGEA